MKRSLILPALAAGALLALAACTPADTTSSSDGATDNPSVGISTHSVVVSATGVSPTAAKASAKPTPSPSVKPAPIAKPTPEAVSSDGSSSNGSSSGGSSNSGSAVPVILSPSGNYYRAGEFCPTRDAGVTTVDSQGREITCVMESGRYHWHYA